MKRGKMALAVVLALVLTLSGSAAVLASSNPTMAEKDLTITNGSATSDTTFNGTIKATQIKVTVPTAVAFDIDPTKEATATNTQITQPDGITITNKSAVPIWVRVTNIAASSGVTLVDNATALSAAKSLMFGLKTTSPTDFSTAADWLKGGDASGVGTITGNYYINDGSALDASTADSADGGALTMKICGQTKYGWKAADTFTVTPTFTVSVTQPTP
ncbi:hypothetical protein [Anaerolentibacter hominis]|uniref:hypothetical protein n=1 Tax=Anaerolentibacter hominis TaxID=3079009 RepID=UPI0031B82235